MLLRAVQAAAVVMVSPWPGGAAAAEIKAATGFNRWHGVCAGWDGPRPLMKINNSALDCQLKQLAMDFGLSALGGGPARAGTVRARLGEALNVAACHGLAAAAPAASLPSPPRGGAAADAAANALASMATRAGCAVADVNEIFVSAAGSDLAGTGSMARPFKSVARGLEAVAAIPPPRGPIIVWLRAGVYYERVALDPAHSGTSEVRPVQISAYPGETVTISGGVPLQGLRWEAAAIAGRNVGAYKAALPAAAAAALGNGFTGLFGAGQRLTRARYPNCDDITGAACFSLNSSGPVAGGSAPPMADVLTVPGGTNLEVRNPRGVDMFATDTDNAPAQRPSGASDGTLPTGQNATLIVEHADYAWRAHDDATFGAQFSTWRSYVPTTGAPGRFDPTFNEPFWDSDVSRGFYFNASQPATQWAPAWTPRAWANPSTGVVHMYHSTYWGGWNFQLFDRNDSDSSLTFACSVPGSADLVACPRDSTPATVQGGWQEARGGSIKEGNGYFVDNIKEELDLAGEWFFDATEGDHGTIYLISPAGDGKPPSPELELVATLHKRVITVVGDSALAPVRNVVLANLTVTHSAATYLDKFEVPSGGDWSVHRGGAIFVDRAVGVGIKGCTLDQVDGSGVFFSRHVRNATVSDNSFFAVGETAILLVGSSAKHRTNMGGTDEYPAFNTIERNLVDTVGVWVKQSAAYFKSIARENVLRSNLLFNGPRSGVNFNDGAMGGEVMEGNLLLNFVRESDDHGPFNSWDRQPYVYRINESDDRTGVLPNGTPRLAMSPRTHTLTQNLIFSYNFHGPSCASVALDHDDESSQYLDDGNVLVHGGIKFFDGMDRAARNNLVLFPQGVMHGYQCFHALSTTLNLSSAHSHFADNHCVLLPEQGPYNCGTGPSPFYNKTHHVETRNNTFSYPGAGVAPCWDEADGSCHGLNSVCACWPGSGTGAGPCGYTSFASMQQHGMDAGSRVQLALSNAAIVAEATALLKR